MTEERKQSVPFSTQVNAIVRKNASYQKRRIALNCCIIVLPLVFLLLLFLVQLFVDSLLDTEDNRCGCLNNACTECCLMDDRRDCRALEDGITCRPNEVCTKREKVCSLRYSDFEQAYFCEVDSPPIWPPVVDIPTESERAEPWKPNVVFLISADNSTVEAELTQRLIRNVDLNATLTATDLSLGETVGYTEAVFGGSIEPGNANYIESAFVEGGLALLSTDCETSQEITNALNRDLSQVGQDFLVDSSLQTEDLAECVKVDFESKTESEINRYLYCSWDEARCNPSIEDQREQNPQISNELTNEAIRQQDKIGQAFNFLDSDKTKFNAEFYLRNWDFELDEQGGPPRTRRAPGASNMIADAWINYAFDGEYRMRMLGFQELPKPGSKLVLEISSLEAAMFSCWVIQLFLPLMLVQLVYEKENNLRIMMKMHGLGDIAYWLVNYLYYLTIYIMYVFLYVFFGSVADFAIFRRNSYGVLAIFVLLFGNTQIAFAFAISNFFSTTRGCVIFSFLWIFGSGFLSLFLFEELISDNKFYNYFIELIPSFAAYRGLYELGEYGFRASYTNSIGLTWDRFGDHNNHMGYVMIVFLIQWPLFLLLAWYFEQIYVSGSGVAKHPLFFLDYFRKKKEKPQRGSRKSIDEQGEDAPSDRLINQPSSHSITLDNEVNDVLEEKIRVENMTEEEEKEHSIILRNLQKVFPAAGGIPEKVAVKELSLAVKKGEVFGLLGPNGAGKTTCINMLIGFLKPTGGEASIEGLDIAEDMKTLYTMMGVCPQHDLLWKSLTGYEHMLFYGRLKGLKGAVLHEASERSLKAVNLFQGGVHHRQVKTYSGGMKRRLSVAISFIGDPQVVYLDEPSTGLDPASRRNLWNVVKEAKKDKAIILTTHNMEEAEVLCDRLGIFVGGQLKVIGNPKYLTARYGGYLVFTVETDPKRVEEISKLVLEHFEESKETYRIAGTLKFELPTKCNSPSRVFEFMKKERDRLGVLDWGVATATLEEVFIKLSKESGATGWSATMSGKNMASSSGLHH